MPIDAAWFTDSEFSIMLSVGSGLRSTTVEREMDRLEVGHVQLWDRPREWPTGYEPLIYSRLTKEGKTGA